MKYLIVAGIVLTTLLLSLLISKKNKQTADKFLIIYLCFATLKQAYFYLETTNFLQQSYFMLFGKGIYLLNAPLLFLYVYALLTSGKLAVKIYAALFLPFIAYTIHFFFFYLWVFDEATLSISNGLLVINGEIAISWLIFVALFLLIEPFCLIWFYVLLHQYRKGSLEAVSDIDHIRLRWLYLLFYLWLVITVILTPLSIFSVGLAWISTEFVQLMIQAASATFFFVLGYYGFKQTSVFTDWNPNNPSYQQSKRGAYQRSGLSAGDAETFHKKLLVLMEEKKPYLNGELKAADLAALMGISVNHLSQTLSQIQKQNFFDFVNSYRIKDVIRKMEDPKNGRLTLLAMALDSGFNSKTSFNAVFKKIMHQTPSNYYKSVNARIRKKA